jgi:hypothetical protein
VEVPPREIPTTSRPAPLGRLATTAVTMGEAMWGNSTRSRIFPAIGSAEREALSLTQAVVQMLLTPTALPTGISDSHLVSQAPTGVRYGTMQVANMTELSQVGRMSRFWLTYRQSGRLAGIAIIDANSLPSARKRAATKTGRRIRFASCTELLMEFAKLVPPTAIGRMLTPNDAAKLIRRFERGILRWQASSSMHRTAKPRATGLRA